MHHRLAALLMTAAMIGPSATRANDWEEFYQALPTARSVTPSTKEPEVIPFSGYLYRDVENMWRRGYGAIGISEFNSINSNIDDAVRFGKKLRAKYIVISTNMIVHSASSIPSHDDDKTSTNKISSIFGYEGHASRTHPGTMSAQGSKSARSSENIGLLYNIAIYFGEVPKLGLGILTREMSVYEIHALKTRKGVAVGIVRDGSPAFLANILADDIITQVNGAPFDNEILDQAISSGAPIRLHIVRNGQPKDLEVNIPPDWRGLDRNLWPSPARR
jgi:hypothetical protein